MLISLLLYSSLSVVEFFFEKENRQRRTGRYAPLVESCRGRRARQQPLEKCPEDHEHRSSKELPLGRKRRRRREPRGPAGRGSDASAIRGQFLRIHQGRAHPNPDSPQEESRQPAADDLGTAVRAGIHQLAVTKPVRLSSSSDIHQEGAADRKRNPYP